MIKTDEIAIAVTTLKEYKEVAKKLLSDGNIWHTKDCLLYEEYWEDFEEKTCIFYSKMNKKIMYDNKECQENHDIPLLTAAKFLGRKDFNVRRIIIKGRISNNDIY